MLSIYLGDVRVKISGLGNINKIFNIINKENRLRPQLKLKGILCLLLLA